MYLFNRSYNREGENNINTLFKGQPFSPSTYLAQQFSIGDDIMYVDDANLLPDAPNLLSLGEYGDENKETISYTGKSENAITGITRALEGTQATFAVGTRVTRSFTAKDLNDLQENQAEINLNRVYNITHTKSGIVHTLAGLPTEDGMYSVQFVSTASAVDTDTWTGLTVINEIAGTDGIAFNSGDYVSAIYVRTASSGVLVFGIGATGAREVFALKTDIPQEQKLTEDTTVYVSPTGSDITGNGSQVNPWKSITHAQNNVPKNLGGHILTISVADGTYELGDKIEEISYFYAGEVVVEAPTEAIFNSNHVGESSKGIIDIRGCDYVLVKNITTKRMVSNNTLHGFLSNLSTVMFVSCKAYGIDATTGRGFNISASKAALKDCVIDNALWAISVNSIASGKYPFCHVSIATTTITNSNTGIVSAASLVFLTNVTNGATTKEFKLSGGQIWS